MDDAEKKKYCKDCEIIYPITEFYKAGGSSYQSRCKKCHVKYNNAKSKIRTVNNPNGRGNYKNCGYHKLPEDTKNELKKYIGTMPLTKLASRLDITYTTLHCWKRKGVLN
jgi:hypothetical protein